MCLGFEEQITRITPFLLIILQRLHIFFTDGRTFIISSNIDVSRDTTTKNRTEAILQLVLTIYRVVLLVVYLSRSRRNDALLSKTQFVIQYLIQLRQQSKQMPLQPYPLLQVCLLL